MEEKSYYENAEVMEDARITIIPKSDFITLIYTSKDIARKFIKMLSNNLEEMESRLLDIAYQSVRQRVANVLIKMEAKLDSTDKDNRITIARRDLSNIVGTATESLNRMLAEFRDDGLIQISDNGIKITNRTKLEKLLH